MDADAEDLRPQTGPKFPIRLATFVAVVLIPFFLSSLYYAFIAADQFTSEARFAVRSLADESASDSSETSLLSMRSATQDAYVVMSFIHSAELLDRLGRKIDYRKMFAPQGIDAIASFDTDGPKEGFLDYWKKQVSVYIDGPSGIVTLKVRTFRPENSLQLALAIVEESEALINEMSTRARNDVLRSVRDEVENAGKTYGGALAELSKFQHESGILSPEAQAEETGKLLAKLLAEKLEIETRQFVAAKSSAEGSPAYQQLKLARDSLDGQIEQLRSGLTGSSDRNLANALVRYSKLETNRMVAEKLYEATRQSYDMVLGESLRKALYVVVFVKPTLPDESLYPLRLFSPLMTLLGLGLLWSTLALAWASVQDHQL
ncbi:capsule biosynthesis protein [Ensifer sp. SL37]|uniref:capsule biosynthesis protein n=1 Tax=Ensifer sp. SL37 TaxID=2995137 RepID=UPI002275E566|nr:capsule biosynthesis protein [Ensifer sp. SL37]MCY1740358.1 capsule biosynthesis protein [Ensifer sp. SL37]